jgi:hypothetical protein
MLRHPAHIRLERGAGGCPRRVGDGNIAERASEMVVTGAKWAVDTTVDRLENAAESAVRGLGRNLPHLVACRRDVDTTVDAARLEACATTAHLVILFESFLEHLVVVGDACE